MKHVLEDDKERIRCKTAFLVRERLLSLETHPEVGRREMTCCLRYVLVNFSKGK